VYGHGKATYNVGDAYELILPRDMQNVGEAVLADNSEVTYVIDNMYISDMQIGIALYEDGENVALTLKSFTSNGHGNNNTTTVYYSVTPIDGDFDATDSEITVNDSVPFLSLKKADIDGQAINVVLKDEDASDFIESVEVNSTAKPLVVTVDAMLESAS